MGASIAKGAVGAEYYGCLVDHKKDKCNALIPKIQKSFSDDKKMGNLISCAIADDNGKQYCDKYLDSIITSIDPKKNSRNILECVLEDGDRSKKACTNTLDSIVSGFEGKPRVKQALDCIINDKNCSVFTDKLMEDLDLGGNLKKAVLSPDVIGIIVGLTIVGSGIILLIAFAIHKINLSK